MKIGTDAFLLGAFFPEKQTGKALDIGTGTGVLSLILAQKNPELTISAIEIEPIAAQEALLNFNHSPFPTKIELIQADFLQHDFETKFDLIVSNPPFFLAGTRSNVNQRDLARNADALPFTPFIEKVNSLLTETGSFWLILPADRFDFFKKSCLDNKLFLSFQTCIYGKENQLKRIVACFKKKQTSCQTTSLIVRNSDNTYTDSYRELTKELHFNKI